MSCCTDESVHLEHLFGYMEGVYLDLPMIPDLRGPVEIVVIYFPKDLLASYQSFLIDLQREECQLLLRQVTFYSF